MPEINGVEQLSEEENNKKAFLFNVLVFAIAILAMVFLFGLMGIK